MQKKQKQLHTLAVHIGTAFVEAALIPSSSAHGEKIELQKVVTVPIGFGSGRVRSALLKHTEVALKKLLKVYAEDSITEVKVVLSSPWYHASVRTVHSTSPQPAPVDIQTILDTVHTYKDQEPPQSGREDLEAVALQVQVNGFPTALHSSSIQGKEVKIHLYESEIDSDVKKSFFTLATDAFPHSTVSLYSFPLAYTLGVREITENANFITLEVGGEVSDVVIVHHDAIQYIASIPIGYYSFARALSDTAEDSIADALSTLTLYARGELSTEKHEKIKAKIESVFKKWHEEFAHIIEEASSHTPIPRALFLLTDTTHGTWIQEGLAFTENKAHEVTSLSATHMQSLVLLGEGGAQNTTLSLLAIFFAVSAHDIFGASEATTHRQVSHGLFNRRESFK